MFSLRLVTVSIAVASAALAQTPAGLQACINNPAYTVCTLGPPPAPATYYQIGPGYYPGIVVNRGNLTLQGQGVWLVSDSHTSPIIDVNFTGTQGVTITGFNLWNIAYPNGSSDYPLIRIRNANIGAWPSNPFANQGPYSVTLYTNSLFYGQGGSQTESMGILIVNYAGLERADDIYIHDNYFDHSTVGSFTNNNDQYSYANQNGSTGCDVTPGFADSQAVYTTRNLRVEHNSFYNEGQGALTLNHARWAGVRNNTFWNDAQVHNSGTDFGGIIFSDECGDMVEISGNTISGAPPAQGPITGLNGLELYGRNITVSGNTISQLYFEAITARNTYNLQILNNTLYDNDTQGSSGLGAISLFDVLTIGSAPDWSRRAVNTTITGNNIGNVSTAYQGWGIVLGYTSPNAIPLNTTIGYNNLYYGNGNRIGPACFFDQSPLPYLPLTPNPQGVSTPGTTISWSTCP